MEKRKKLARKSAGISRFSLTWLERAFLSDSKEREIEGRRDRDETRKGSGRGECVKNENSKARTQRYIFYLSTHADGGIVVLQQ